MVRLHDGEMRRGKLLSSGVVPVTMLLSNGQALAGAGLLSREHPGSGHSSVSVIGNQTTSPSNVQATWVRLPELLRDCDHFWNGSQLLALDGNGGELFHTRIADFRSGGWALLNEDVRQIVGQATAFEIRSSIQAPVVLVHRLLQVPFNTDYLKSLYVWEQLGVPTRFSPALEPEQPCL